jgi:hypothetical protein
MVGTRNFFMSLMEIGEDPAKIFADINGTV